MAILLAPQGTNITRLALVLFFAFKLSLVAAAVFTIYLGYSLFILGVSGEASISVDAKDVSGQLLNAAPGLFFAVGGIVTLVVMARKDINLSTEN